MKKGGLYKMEYGLLTKGKEFYLTTEASSSKKNSYLIKARIARSFSQNLTEGLTDSICSLLQSIVASAAKTGVSNEYRK